MPKKIVIIAICLPLIFLMEYLGLFLGINNYCYDLAYRIRGMREPLARIVIVAVDEATLTALGRWPLKRSHYTTLLEKTTEADIVAFDIMMVEPSPDDKALAQQMQKHGRVVLPVAITSGMTIEFPDPVFAPFAYGHVHIERGIDGIAREVHHTLFVRERLLASLSTVIYEIIANKPFPRHQISAAFPDRSGIVQSDPMLINYYGGPGTFTRLSFLDVINGAYPHDYFRGKIVILGITALGLVDSAITPFSETRTGTPGVEIQANILNNLLASDAVSVVPMHIRWIIGASLGLLLYFCFFRISEGWGVVLLSAVIVGYFAVVLSAFSWRHIWYEPAGTGAVFVAVFALAYILKLGEAAISLGRTYDAIMPHLRHARVKDTPRFGWSGLSEILTPKGIQTQAALLSDITHQLIFEKELSDRILMSDVFGVAVYDPAGKLNMANRDMRDLCAANAILLESRDGFTAGLAQYVMSKEKDLRVFEQWVQTRAVTVCFARPRTRYLQLDLSMLAVGQKEYALFILTDITKVKEVEILKGQIVSIVSHELKTPMTNIQGFSELLVDDLEGEKRQYAGIILEESVRLTKFVNTFLDINRIEEGRQQIRKAPVEMSSLVRQAALKMQPIAAAKGIKIVAAAPDGQFTVDIDRDLTEQAIINLAENAVKYSPENREVTIRLVVAEQQSVRIEVEDNGYGIREEDQMRIFEKFYRANAEAAEDVKGSGLGLTFVKEAVEAQGGRVSLSSTFGKGSTFSIIFPRP